MQLSLVLIGLYTRVRTTWVGFWSGFETIPNCNSKGSSGFWFSSMHFTQLTCVYRCIILSLLYHKMYFYIP
jgi:hypothetical protein